MDIKIKPVIDSPPWQGFSAPKVPSAGLWRYVIEVQAMKYSTLLRVPVSHYCYSLGEDSLSLLSGYCHSLPI